MCLEHVGFDRLPGWNAREARSVWPAFVRSAKAIEEGRASLRGAVEPSPALKAACRAALALSDKTGDSPNFDDAAAFFQEWFSPARICAAGFLTGYYEPETLGSRIPSPDFAAPALARPDDLIDMRGTETPGWDRRIQGARTSPDGRLQPYPTRAEIEDGAIDGASRALVWLRDAVELFLIQVQGSARVTFPDGARCRLIYDGRNGRPYTSVGRILIEAGYIPADEMSLARLKACLRDLGLGSGEAGRAIMHCNESYVFFRLAPAPATDEGPIGGQGLPLTPRRSLAVDRDIWSYGLPFWIGADLPALGMTPRTGRLWIAQDTGSAIVGPARFDMFAGTGEAAGALAGDIRHGAECFVLLPRAVS